MQAPIEIRAKVLTPAICPLRFLSSPTNTPSTIDRSSLKTAPIRFTSGEFISLTI